MLAIVDSGGANIASVRFALERLGIQSELTTDLAVIRGAERVILPGVGSANEGMKRLQARGLVDCVRNLKQPVLGICLGMQLLFDRSEETDIDCLGIIPGKVYKLDPSPGAPVPHMGWSRVEVQDPAIGIRSGEYVYFAHAYVCGPGPTTVATVDYCREIPAVVRQGNWLGAQFHPERSGEVGSRFLKAFLG